MTLSSPPPPSTRSRSFDSQTSSSSDRKSHIEVCARIRPLVVVQECSRSFLNASSSTPLTPFTAATTTTTTTPSKLPTMKSRLRKPQIPRLAFARKSTSTGSHGSNDSTPVNTNTSTAPSTPTSTVIDDATPPPLYAWNVKGTDTAVQATEAIPGRTHAYTLDQVYGPDVATQDVFDASVKPLVHAAMDGYHASVLAYGQTSTGKTHTMTGTALQPGLIPLCVQECFHYARQQTTPREYLFRVSYLEVYKEHVQDLLAPTNTTSNSNHINNAPPPTPIRMFDGPDGLVIQGLQEIVVTDPAEVFTILARGETYRAVGATSLNAHSSRSHVIVRLWIESRGTSTDTHASGTRVSSLSLVDLAGSESVRLTGSMERRQEGHYINKSLMTLGQVVYALSTLSDKPGNSSNRHIPYRDSKLTRLLQPSLSGQAQVVLICCISPLVSHIEESHHTFQFATRAKKIPQKAKVNTIVDEKTLLQSYRDEIEDLKQQLQEARQQQLAVNVHAAPVDLDVDEEISELVVAIKKMEHLIIKSRAAPEDWMDSLDIDLNRQNTNNNNNTSAELADDDETLLLALGGGGGPMDGVNHEDDELMALANGRNRSISGVFNESGGVTITRTPTKPSHDDVTSDLHVELARIQGLLGSVLKKKRQQHHNGPLSSRSSHNGTPHDDSNSNNQLEVETLRRQLEEQEVVTSIRQADSSFLQQQLEEKDNLLREVSKILEAIEERQTQLEQENMSLKQQLAAYQSKTQSAAAPVNGAAYHNV
jgi:centromeric protein E